MRVPRDHLIGPQGHGFVLSQVRLGPGRLHHATRWLAEAERAFDMMCERAQSRSSFGKSYTRHQMVQEYIADSRIELETAKLLTLRAAWKFDREGNRAARSDIAMCKVYNAQVVHNVVDRALQVHGSLGYSGDMPLESMYRMARMASLVDGANEVHKVSVAKSELARYEADRGLAQRTRPDPAGRRPCAVRPPAGSQRVNRTAAAFDVPRFTDWLGQVTGEPAEVTVTPMSGGASCEMFRVERLGRSWVVRRAPLTSVSDTAHHVVREARVIESLAGSASTGADDPGHRRRPRHPGGALLRDVLRRRRRGAPQRPPRSPCRTT